MTETDKFTVVSYTVVESGVSLITDQGNTMHLSQSKFNIPKLVEAIAKPIAAGKTVTLSMAPFSHDVPEEGANKFFKFIKKAFYTVRSVFVNEVNEEVIHVETINSPTTVLVVGDVEVPGIDNLMNHINHAVNQNNVEGINKFLERIAKVIDKRGHSADELMKFLSECDMPIADDGTIIAYKTLCRGTGALAGMYVDPHSRKVPQDLGSEVSMDIALVDNNRRQQCSTGLHVARREYLRGYRGDEVFIIKVAPEDVIAVPAYDTQKMRVARYVIVGKLSSVGREAIYAGKSIAGIAIDEQAVAEIIKGKHIATIHTVHIGGAFGTNLTINGKTKSEIDEKKPVPVPVEPTTEIPAEEEKTLEPEETSEESTYSVEEAVSDVKVEPVKEVKLTNKQIAVSLYEFAISPISKESERIDAVTRLLALKKKAKVSWVKLGITATDEFIQSILSNPSQFSVLVTSKSAKAKEARKVDLTQIKQKTKAVSEDHAEILKAFDGGASFKSMQKTFKKSRTTLRSIIGQYRDLNK